MDRRVALIVNPVAGGGRARQGLPPVEAELRALGIDFHREETSSLINAEQLARDATATGEAVFTLGGDVSRGAGAGWGGGWGARWPNPPPRSVSFRAGAATTSPVCWACRAIPPRPRG